MRISNRISKRMIFHLDQGVSIVERYLKVSLLALQLAIKLLLIAILKHLGSRIMYKSNKVR